MALTATSFINANDQAQPKKTGINYLSSTAVSRLNAQNRNDAIKAQEAQSYNNGGLWGGLNYLSEKLATGFMSSIEGIWDYTAGGLAKLFGADDWAEKQFANDWFGDWYSSPDEWYNPSKGWQTAGDIAGGIGTSLPAIVAVVGGAAITAASGGSLSPLGAGLISAGVAGLGAAGNATKQAYRETGQLTGKEFGYGALVGVTEGGIEGVSNALSMGTAQIVKSATKAFAKGTAKAVAKQSVIKTLGKGFIGEAFEEGVSEILDPYWQRLTYNPEAKNATAQEIAYAAFVGGMSGLIMNGFDVSIDSGNSFIKGNNIVNKGLDSEVIGLSEQLSAFEDINHTGDETFEGLSETFKKLSESLKMTGGKVSTVTQKKLLGDLQRANTAAIFKPMISKSAANIVNNAEAIAARLTEYGYKTPDGKPITFTAEQIRAGVDPKNPKSLSNALKSNNILRTLAVADTTGHLIMDTAKFEQATLAGKRLASQVDLNRFVETATPAEIKSVSEALKIDNWAMLDSETFNQKITEFIESGGVQRQANRRTLINEIRMLPPETARPIPKMVNLRQDGPVRYSDGKTDIAISKQGDTYTVFDYSSENLSKDMTRSEVNKLLRHYNVQQADITAAARAQAEAANELRRQAAELDIFARDNIADYNKLSSPNQSMIRKVIRAGRANGLSDGDVLAYAKISARSGIDIVFDKNANYTGKNGKGEDTYSDGFYEREKNRIVVNPEGKRSADRLLLHELEHSILKGKDGKKLIATAFRNTDKKFQDKIIEKYKKFFKDEGLDEVLTEKQMKSITDDEISAHYAEDVLSNRNTLEKLLEAEPTMKDKILSFFKGAETDYADVPKLSRAAKRYYNTYKKLFDGFSARNQQNNAMENGHLSTLFAENAQKETLTGANDENAQVSEREYALGYTTDNKAVAVIENDIFDGKFDELSETERVRIAKNAIKEFRPGIPIKGRLIGITRKTAEHFANSDYTDKIRNHDPKLYEDKLNVSQNIDDVIFASTNYINEDLKHQRNDNIVQFARGSVFLDIGGNKYEASVIVGYTSMSEMVLYDVQDLTPTKFTLKSKKMQPTLAGNNSDTSKTVASSDNSIPQTTAKSNTSAEKSSEKSSDGKQRALNFNDDDFAVKKKEVSYAEPDKVTMSKGALQKKNADYKSDKTYSRKDVAASLEEIELFKSLPSAIRNDYINSVWNGLNSQFSGSKREAFIDVKSKQLYQTFLNETHLLDNLDRTETDKISDNIVLALRKLLDKGTPSVRAKLEAEFNTSDAGFWKKQYNEANERNRIKGQLMSKAQQMKDLKLGTFANVTQHHSEIFKNSIEQLSRIQWRGNLSEPETRKVLEDLKKWYTSKDVKEGLLAYTNELSPGIYVSGVADTLETLTESQGGFTVDELKMLLDIMSYFTNFVENWGKVFRAGKWVEAKPEAQRYIDTIHANEKLKSGMTLKISGTAYTQMFGDPMTVARRMDMYESGFYTEIMTELRNAAVDAQVAEMELRKSYDEFLDKNKKYVEKASSETVQYLGADIPRIQLISLYMTMKRRHSWAGLAENGFTFTDVKGNKVRVNGSMGPGDTRITDAELTEHMKKRVAAVEKLLTDTDKQYIAILEQAFNVEARKLKADRDMQRLGFTNATNDYYYPIRRANTAKNVDTSVTSELDRVSNSSFNKDTVKGAKQELFIESADAVFNRHIHAVCQYAYLSPAVEAYNVLYNMDVSGNSNKPISIRTESENTWKRGNEYFTKLIADIQGIPATSGEGQEVLAFIRGGYAKYQLGANPKVWLTQLSSIFASSSMLDADSITRGMTISAKGVDEYCSIAKLRNYDNTAAMAQGVLDTKAKRAVSAIGKFSDALMIPIGKMDRFVVCRTFGACQAQVEKNGGAKVGTEENKVEAGKLLRQVILETQQNSVATERSAAMRSGNEIYRTLTMFSADSMKVIGRVIDGYGEVSVLRAKLKATNDAASKTELKTRLKSAHKKTRKSVAALLTSAAFMAGVAQLFRHIYDKEQKEDESVIETMVADFGGNLIGGLPLFRDLYSRFVDGYAADNYAYSAFNDLLDSSINLFDAAKNIISGEGTAQERNLAIRNITYSAGQLFGVPTRNMYNVLYGLTKRFSPETAYAIDGAFYAKNYQNDLYRAIESDDDEKATYILGLLMGERMNEDMDATVFNEILNLSKSGQKVLPRSVPTSITIDDTEYMLSEAEQAQIKSVYAGAEKALKTLFSKPKYNSLSDEQKAAAIDYVYDIYYQKALADTFGDERNAKSFLISDLVGAENLALLSIGTKGLESDVDPNGNVISGSKRKKVVAAINSLNISIDKKLLLICAKGYSLKDNDIRGMSAVKAKKRLLAYILQLKGVSKSEKTELAEMCGFEVKNGKIITKNTFNYNKLRPKAT